MPTSADARCWRKADMVVAFMKVRFRQHLADITPRSPRCRLPRVSARDMRTSLPSASALLQRNVQPISPFGLVADDMGQRGKDNIGVLLERRAYLLAPNHSGIFGALAGGIGAAH